MRTMMRSASWLFEALAGLTSVLVRLPAADVGRTKCRAVGRAMGLPWAVPWAYHENLSNKVALMKATEVILTWAGLPGTA